MQQPIVIAPLSDAELASFAAAQAMLQAMRTAPAPQPAKINVMYKDGVPHADYNGSYIPVLERFDNVIDLRLWVNRKMSPDNHEEWLIVPRHRRLLHGPSGTKTQHPLLRYTSFVVKNLSVRTSPFHLREIFSQYGNVRDAYIPKQHGKDGKRQSYGFIELELTIPMETMLAEFASFSTLNGKKMEVSISQSHRKSSDEMATN
jgi:RNA recognition motif-containing protein